MRSSLKSLKVLVVCFLCTHTALPCTTFVQQSQGQVYFGRNLDWFWENGLVLVNPRAVQKTAFLLTERSPAKWTARFGSVTFNQFGREMPFGGMNEAGLVVENLQLGETGYAAPDARPAINLTQWIQYQLDNCRTVAEVIATDKQLRIEPAQPALRAQACMHYLVCDASGDCASIEFLAGKTVVHRGTTLTCPVLANDPYDAATHYLAANPLPTPLPPRAKDHSSLARFAHAAARTAAFKASEPAQDIAYAFATLDQVCQGEFTAWRMVYDVTARQIQYRTRSQPETRRIDLKALDFSGGRPVQFVDIQALPAAGAGLPFAELTEARHRQYLEAFFALPTVTLTLGDLTQLREGLLMTLRTYGPAAPGK